MKELTKEWVAKAEDDYDDAQRILRARNRTDFSNSCFHSQQCAEKYMKAVFVERGAGFDRSHNLAKLLQQLLALDLNPFWKTLERPAGELTVFAVQFRYPEGRTADRMAARRALSACREIRDRMREHLGAGPWRRNRPAARRKRTR